MTTVKPHRNRTVVTALSGHKTVLYSAAIPMYGKSAYQLAVQEGFEGTLQEWLDSLAVDGGGITLPIAQSAVSGLIPRLDAADAELATTKTLAQVNQLNIGLKADRSELETTNTQVELNRLGILTKADLTALSALALLVSSKADSSAVAQQIADLVGTDTQVLAAIQNLGAALAEDQDLLDALEYTVANRVRFDTSTQALTSLQKANARTNISAEELGTAALLIAQITAASLGAATAAQGAKADTALQSADVAPVALSGNYNDLSNLPTGHYTRLFSRGRANINRLLFNSLSPAQIIHNGFLTVPAEYNVIGGVCLFEFDLYTSALAQQSGTFRIFVSETNLINSGATNIGSNSLDGVALSCQFSFVRATATHVVLALRVNGSLVAKQRISNPNIPAAGNAANFSIRFLTSVGDTTSLEYIESISTTGYGNHP